MSKTKQLAKKAKKVTAKDVPGKGAAHRAAKAIQGRKSKLDKQLEALFK